MMKYLLEVWPHDEYRAKITEQMRSINSYERVYKLEFSYRDKGFVKYYETLKQAKAKVRNEIRRIYGYDNTITLRYVKKELKHV